MNPYTIQSFLDAPVAVKLFYHFIEHHADEFGLFSKTDCKPAFLKLNINPNDCENLSEYLSGLIIVGSTHLLLLSKVQPVYYKSRKANKQATNLYATLLPDWWASEIESKRIKVKSAPSNQAKPIEERKAEFKARIVKAIKEMNAEGKPEISTDKAKRFFEHWTQIPDNSTKMLFESRNTFSTKGRLAKWK